MNFACARAALKLSLLFAPALLIAEPPADFHSTEVNPDRTITFHYKDAAATSVSVALDGVAKPIPMEKDEAGVWSLTSQPLTPEIYGYHFVADGDVRLDPANPRMTRNLVNLSNMVTVPGDTPQPWDATNVPHGTLHHHTYSSTTVLGLTNLLAQGRIKPMLVVMPLGYGDMSFVRDHGVWNQAATVDHNTSLFTQALLTEVLPQVESGYKVSRKREDRAIVGLSMGGLESLTTGLTHADKFAWVGGFSSAVHNLGYDGPLATLDPKAANLRLLWIACGTEDGLIEPNRKFVAFLKSKNMPVTQVETPGLHNWMVWRDNLTHFTPLLFQDK